MFVRQTCTIHGDSSAYQSTSFCAYPRSSRGNCIHYLTQPATCSSLAQLHSYKSILGVAVAVEADRPNWGGRNQGPTLCGSGRTPLHANDAPRISQLFPSATTIEPQLFCRGRDASLRPRHPGQSSITMRIRIPAASSLAGPCLVRSCRPRTLSSLVSRPSCDRLAACTTRRSRNYASVSAAQLQFGQPVHETHPHILKPGERKQTSPPRAYNPLRPGLQLKPSPTAADAAAA